MAGNWDSVFTSGCHTLSDLGLQMTNSIFVFILTSLFRPAISAGRAITAVSESRNPYSSLVLHGCRSYTSNQAVIFRFGKSTGTYRLDFRSDGNTLGYQSLMGISLSLRETHCILHSFVLPSTNADMKLARERIIF